MSAILIVLVCVGAVIGAVVGYFKKFTKTSFWGITSLLTLLLERAIGAGVKKGSAGYAPAVLITTVVILMLLSLVAVILKKLLQKAVDSRKRLSHYKNFDDVEESEALILSAVDSGDKRQYRRELRKRRRIKDGAGGWGIVDGVLGALNCSINVLMALGSVILVMLMLADISGLKLAEIIYGTALKSGSWKGLGHSLALDMPIICVLALSLRIGYKSGISSILGIVVIVGMLGGFAISSWAIASSEACAPAIEGLKNHILSGVSGMLGSNADTVAKAILAAIIYLLSLVFVILAGICIPKVCDKLRESKVILAIDGVAGAFVLCTAVIAVITLFGGIAFTLSDLPFMEGFNAYANNAHFGDCVYTYNLFGNLIYNLIPIRSWFG
ncbi:MAG: hypothetical protein K2K39_01480 [Clostridia bacterium]|nr:hypothetical protein [Clostridia bacterium]